MHCRLHGYPCFRFSVWAKTGEIQKDHEYTYYTRCRVLNTSCNSSLCCPTRSPLRMEAFSIECRKTRTKEIMTESKSKFQLSVESNPWLDWFCLTTVCDWSRKFAPISQPIKCKTKIDRDVVTCVFPRYREFACLFCSDRPLWSLGFFPPGPPAFLPSKNCWHLFVTFSARIMYYMYIH